MKRISLDTYLMMQATVAQSYKTYDTESCNAKEKVDNMLELNEVSVEESPIQLEGLSREMHRKALEERDLARKGVCELELILGQNSVHMERLQDEVKELKATLKTCELANSSLNDTNRVLRNANMNLTAAILERDHI